jgi:flagellar basal-body rod modification protein FlgD
MSMATVTAQQTQSAVAAAQADAQAAASGTSSSGAAGTSATAGTAATTGQNALTSLSGNFNDFLSMLTTQLQNQDPSSPMDTDQFTQELVEFSGVEQQINTNSSLTQLIQLTQGNEVMQSGAIDGKQVTVQANQIALQNGKGEIQFTSPAAEPAAIAIYNSSGQQITSAVVQATAGSNTWTWNGADGQGNTVPDGVYNIAVVGANTDGSTTALPFTVVGTATSVQNTASGGVQLQLGALGVGFGSVQSVGN